MNNRLNFKKFIEESIAPREATNSDYNKDLHVDVYGNFEVIFEPCCSGKDFADSDRIRSYGLLGDMLFDDKNLHRFIKSINDVEMNIHAKTLDTPGFSYAIHRLMPMNSSNNISMQWLSTKTPFIETVFVPWMQDNTIYGHFPLVKADLVITFPLLSYKSLTDKTIQYKYYGIRPIEVGLHKMTNEPLTEFYRKVAFDFDYFYANTIDATRIGER